MTKLSINTDILDKELIPFLDQALDNLNKSYEIAIKLVTPNDYPYIKEINDLKYLIEKLKNITRDYNNSYHLSSSHFNELTNTLLLDIKSIKNINIFKK